MDVAIAGAHGQVARRLTPLLAARGDRVRGLIRNPAHADDVRADGAEPVLLDLENAGPDEVAAAIDGADAVVFAAGAGPGSGPERKRTVDYGGAVKLIEAAKANGVSRYAIVSSMGADAPERAPEAMRPYQEAKAAADEALRESGLDFTIVRPGMLTDDPGTGHVDAAPKLGRRGSIPRDDVAAVLLAVLDEPSAIGKTFDVLSGDVPIEEAVRNIPPDPG
jgi:uncharacterized protein YbjT (DUF2867 family)